MINYVYQHWYGILWSSIGTEWKYILRCIKWVNIDVTVGYYYYYY